MSKKKDSGTLENQKVIDKATVCELQKNKKEKTSGPQNTIRWRQDELVLGRGAARAGEGGGRAALREKKECEGGFEGCRGPWQSETITKKE